MLLVLIKFCQKQTSATVITQTKQLWLKYLLYLTAMSAGITYITFFYFTVVQNI